MLLSASVVKAQYYQIANQLSNVLSPALSGSMNYKGYVEASGLAGFGDNHANFVGISTSQGFQYASWFYMGAGLGVDLVTVNGDVMGKDDWNGSYPDYYNHSSSTTRCMIPVFTDFRFNVGPSSGIKFFIDLKLGASWLIGSRYLTLQRGRLTGQTQFLLKPALGVRIPTSAANPKQAVNVGVVYQLITSNSNYYNRDGQSVSLNAVGVSLSYEW